MYTFNQAALSQEKLQRAPRSLQEPSQKSLLVVPRQSQESPTTSSREAALDTKKEQEALLLEVALSMTLSELEKGDKVVRIRSKLFREDVLLVPDHYIPRPEDPVCYTVQEARLLLMTQKDEDLRTIHETKKLSRGHVIYAARGIS